MRNTKIPNLIQDSSEHTEASHPLEIRGFEKQKNPNSAPLSEEAHRTSMIAIESNHAPEPIESLTYTARQACAALGIKRTSLWRLERRGLIRALPGIRHKLYSRKAVARYVEGKAGVN